MVTLTLTDDQAGYLKDVLDFWVDGYGESFQTTMADPTFDEPEQLLEAMSGLNEQVAYAVEIREML